MSETIRCRVCGRLKEAAFCLDCAEDARMENEMTPEAPYCPDHGTMIPDDEMGRSWHCVCDRTAETP